MSAAVQWDPRDYAVNSSSQALWAQELMERVDWRGDEVVLDVGCGDGRLTAELAARVPSGRVLGIDSSAEMVAHAQRTHPSVAYPNLRFARMDAAAIQLPREYDLVFSNAALHWVAERGTALSAPLAIGVPMTWKPNMRASPFSAQVFARVES